MVEFIEALDLGSNFAIDNLHHPWLTPLVWAVAFTGSAWFLAGVAFLAAVGLGLVGRWRAGLLVALACLTTMAVCQVTQPLVGRPLADVKSWPDRPPGYSFPSAAAAVSVVTYGLVVLSVLPLLPSRRWQSIVVVAVVGLVLGIGFSQMYLALGYLSDLVGGWALGLSVLLVFHWLDVRYHRAALPERPTFNRGAESVTVKESGLRQDRPSTGASR